MIIVYKCVDRFVPINLNRIIDAIISRTEGVLEKYDLNNVSFVEKNNKNDQKFLSKYEVTQFPTLLFFKDNVLVKKHVGPFNLKKILIILKNL